MNDVAIPIMGKVNKALGVVMNSLTPAFEVFAGPEIAIGISLILLCLAALVFLLMVVRFAPLWFQVGKLTKLVDRINSDYPKFKIAYPEIDEKIRKHKFLRHAWREYTETLVLHGEDPDKPVRNTIRPQHYINLEAAEVSGRGIRNFHALPNYFVGVGLLSTFIGLVTAIKFASEGVASGDVNEAQESLGKLLNAATFKFMTSIAGLGASLFLSFSYRSFTQVLQRKFDELCESLEKGILFATQESIAYEQLLELSEQTSQLKRFNTDFAIEVGEVLEDRLRGSMTKSLEEALKPLVGTMERMVGTRFLEVVGVGVSSGSARPATGASPSFRNMRQPTLDQADAEGLRGAG